MSVDVPAGYDARPIPFPFDVLVGPFHLKDDESGPLVGFRVGPQHLDESGKLDGAVLMVLADIVMGSAVTKFSGHQLSLTVNVQTQFLRSASLGDWVEGTPFLLHRTEDVYFLRGEVRVGGELIFITNGAFRVRPRSEKAA